MVSRTTCVISSVLTRAVGMQRFGTAYIPTHSIGLALLQSDWHRAISLILQPRHGEHPDVASARKAWLEDGDLDRALELMPRRVVAERCILESYKKQKGETRNAMGALSTVIPALFVIYLYSSPFCTDSKEPSSHVRACISVVCLECHRVRTNQDVWR